MAQAAGRKLYTWRDPAPLSRTVIGWLYVDMAVAILSIPVTAWVMSELAAYGRPEELLPSDLPDLVLILAQLIVITVASILGARWIYRVTRNAWASASGLTTPPPWAVGWFFIPVANLWKPFGSFVDVWQVSTNPTAWRTVRTPGILRWWWGLLLASMILGNAAFRISMMSDTPGAQMLSSGLDIGRALVTIPLDMVFMRLVRQLTALQTETLAPIARRDETLSPATGDGGAAGE